MNLIPAKKIPLVIICAPKNQNYLKDYILCDHMFMPRGAFGLALFPRRVATVKNLELSYHIYIGYHHCRVIFDTDFSPL